MSLHQPLDGCLHEDEVLPDIGNRCSILWLPLQFVHTHKRKDPPSTRTLTSEVVTKPGDPLSISRPAWPSGPEVSSTITGRKPSAWPERGRVAHGSTSEVSTLFNMPGRRCPHPLLPAGFRTPATSSFTSWRVSSCPSTPFLCLSSSCL